MSRLWALCASKETPKVAPSLVWGGPPPLPPEQSRLDFALYNGPYDFNREEFRSI